MVGYKIILNILLQQLIFLADHNYNFTKLLYGNKCLQLIVDYFFTSNR